jgi:hypothetical protein
MQRQTFVTASPDGGFGEGDGALGSRPSFSPTKQKEKGGIGCPLVVSSAALIAQSGHFVTGGANAPTCTN